MPVTFWPPSPLPAFLNVWVNFRKYPCYKSIKAVYLKMCCNSEDGNVFLDDRFKKPGVFFQDGDTKEQFSSYKNWYEN